MRWQWPVTQKGATLMKYMIYNNGQFVRFVGAFDQAAYMVEIANQGAKNRGSNDKYEVRVAVGE